MQPLQRLALPIIGLIAAGLIVAIGLVGAPGTATAELLMFLAVSGLCSFGLAAIGLTWLRRGRGPLWLQMTFTYGVGIVVSLVNILLTVRAMLLSNSDLPLLVLLLLFAGVLSLGLGIRLAQAIGQRVEALNAGARRVAAGDLEARVSVGGSDELAELGREFNQMATRLADAAAERTRQEAARRELIAAVSHDLRTPLTSLRVMTEALADGVVEGPEDTQRYLGTMRGQISLLSGLIDDLFELAQFDAGALVLARQPVLLGDLLSDVINGLRPQAAARGITLSGALPDAPLHTTLDPQKIERVLHNLVANAIRHTPAGGTVQISAARTHAPAGLCVDVRDSGEGIAAADLPRVFERFYRGEKSRSRATGGAGLGLAIARAIVEAHGGQISITSQLGQGTSVRFTLPAS